LHQANRNGDIVQPIQEDGSYTEGINLKDSLRLFDRKRKGSIFRKFLLWLRMSEFVKIENVILKMTP